MLNVLTNSSLSLFTTDAETLKMMWQTVVLGIGMVFAVLAVLWLVLSVFKLIFAGKTPPITWHVCWQKAARTPY